MKNYNKLISVFLLLCLLSSCKEEVQEVVEIIRPVEYETVGDLNVQDIRTFSGVASASDRIELSFRNSGIITQLNIEVGDRVRKGDLIAKLDNVQAELSYEQSISALNASLSALNTSRLSLDRTKSLYEKGSKSLSDYETAKNAFQSALDKHQSAQRNKEIKQSQIDYGYIYAPQAGIIAIKNGNLNENVQSGQVIVIINAGNKVELEVGIPGNVINKITAGMKTKVSFSAIEEKTFEGVVIEVAPIVNANSSTFPVKLNILQPDPGIRPGMIGSVTFILQKNINTALIIPVKSVGENGDGNFVFLIESQDNKIGIVKKQTVVLGNLTNAGFIIKSGLTIGQKIATAGLQSLLDGQKVRLR